MESPRWLTADESRAWYGYRRMRALLDLHNARALAASSGLSEADYDVLSTLSEAGNRLRLNELADHLLWSRSRLSHQLTRMRGRGLIVREDCETDGRGAFVALSEEGVRVIVEAAPAHVAFVRRSFIDLLTPEQLAVLAEVTEAVVENLGED
ncbi:MarR family winged helix-turn-helix transcriptional regulator [Allokutzneria oryzae]|uniref:MarR family winged helix-turn-helix transcriptional regulator n=1 Tax=Allokutzneria oryzae TaxID=1378989 RepID=A0ABV6A368_9PSEU